jgi:two-component system sensor kinase FixL
MEREPDNHLTEEVKRLKERLAGKDREIGKLRMNHLFLETLFDDISEEIMVIDPDYNITYTNRTFLERYGLSKPDAAGRKCYEIKERLGAPCSKVNKSCPLEIALQTGERVELTHLHRGPGDEAQEYLLTMYPLTSGGRQGPDYFVEIARELTDFRGLISKLQASQKRFRAILDTATSAILSINEDHEIILFNNAAERIFGYSRREILGENLNALVPPQYGNHGSFVRRFMEKRESDVIGKTLSLTALRKGGEEFPIELSLSSMEMDGRMTFTAIIKDVSPQQQLEKKLLQSERLAAVGQAVAHVAHEIRNPLMIIGGFSSQMRRNLTDERDIHKLEMILEEVNRLERLVAGLGDFTKSYRLVKRMTDINAVIQDVVKIMTEVYPSGQYALNQDFSHHLKEINCDPDKLKQVFINIISNGFEAMAEGGAITISTESLVDGIEIRIRDEGIGIPDEELQHIFEPFYTTRKSGSGLGLAISYKIIEAHHGDISAISRPGEGTTFIIRLPAS